MSSTCWVVMLLQQVHDELGEEFTLQQLGKKICDHLTCGTVGYGEFARLDSVSNQIIVIVDVFCVLAA